MSVFGLPSNLGVIADAADQTATVARFELRSVEVAISPCKRTLGKYRVAATDLNGLAVVEGPLLDVSKVEGLESVRTADGSATHALVPASEFRKVFADATRFARKGSPSAVLAALGESVATFGVAFEAPDQEAEQVRRAELDQGMFPPVFHTIKLSTADPPVATATMSAKTLADLARIAETFGEQVTIEFRKEGRPLVMTTRNANQKVTLIAHPEIPEPVVEVRAPAPTEEGVGVDGSAMAEDCDPRKEPQLLQ